MRSISISVAAFACVVGAAEPARAQQQSFAINLGALTVRGDDTRVRGDVIFENRQFLTFDVNDFAGATIGAEYLVGLGNFVEAGVGASYYRRTVPTVYARLTHQNGAEIGQDLRLQIVPVAATLRVLPLGRHAGFQPYVGGGVALFHWRYSEFGEFVDFRDRSIFQDSFTTTGNDAGAIVLGGARGLIGDAFAIGGEIRYQRAQGRLPDPFAGDKIDLGGMTYQATFQFRF